MSDSQLKLFEMAVMQSWNAIVITDADLAAGCRVQIANPAFCAMTGYSLDELKGGTLKRLQGEQTDPAVIDSLRRALKEARSFEGVAVNYRKDGSSYTVRWNISAVRNDAGVVTHFVSVQQDISAHRAAERKIELLARALNVTSAPIVLTDAKSRIIFANTAFAETTGYEVDDLIGQTPALLRSGKHGEAFYGALRQALSSGQDFSATFINRRRDGTLYHAEQSISPIYDGQGRITHYVAVSKDVSERVRREEVLRHEASQDKLTGLHNRRHGEKLLNEACARARLQGTPLTLIICDIDHFKQVNDRFGHPVGDRVLRAVATILRGTVRSNDAVIRWGGEEFIILLNDCTQTSGAELAERLRHGVGAHVMPEVGQVTISQGLATLGAHETIDQLIARADTTLYQSKVGGRNRVSIAADL